MLRSLFLWLQDRSFCLAKDRFSSRFPPHYLNCWKQALTKKGEISTGKKKKNNHDKKLPLWGTGLHLEKSQSKPRVCTEKKPWGEFLPGKKPHSLLLCFPLGCFLVEAPPGLKVRPSAHQSPILLFCVASEMPSQRTTQPLDRVPAVLPVSVK